MTVVLAGLRVAVSLVVAALAAAAPPARAAGQRSELDAIYALLAERRFTEAREQWNRLIPRLQATLASPPSGAAGAEKQRQRQVAEAQFVQGLLAARFGTRDEALGLLRQADGNGFPPLDSPLMLLAADTLLDLDEPASAAQAYAEVLKRTPAAAAVRVRRGAALFAAGRAAMAEAEFERVAREAPDTPQAAYWLGALRFEQKRVDEAKALLERELARDAKCSGCIAKLAHVAYLAGDDGRCEALLGRAMALDPGQAEAHLVAGMLASRAGRYDEAIDHLSRVVAQAGRSAAAHYQLALAYRRRGDADEARAHQAIYDRLVAEQKAKALGVRGAE
jgi:tetratricopeptide (TPR) repeat protein